MNYFPYSIQIRQTLWKELSLAELHRDIKSSSKPRIIFYRELSARLSGRGGSVTAGELNLYALSLRIQRFLIREYLDKESTPVASQLLADAGIPPGSPELAAFVRSFCRVFPGGPFLDHPELDPSAWLEAEPTAGRHQTLVAEMLLLNLAVENRALDGFRELLDPAELFLSGDSGVIVAGIVRSLVKSPPLTPTGMTLPDFLRLPLKAYPASLYGQLEYMKTNWQRLLPEELLPEIFGAFAVMKEEWGLFAPQGEPGPSPVLEFGRSTGPATNDYYPEPERFSADTDWMPNVVLLAKMVYVWLGQLSSRYGTAISRLDQIPDAELDRLARWGVTGLWLIGLWERSPASQTIKQICGNPEAISSAYSLFDYAIAADLGGEEALWDLRQRALKRGIRLASDMVPNHTGLFSKWIVEHPDWFVQLDYPPYPAYRFTGTDLSSSPDISLHIEDGYWERRDAAVVFKHYDHRTGRTRYIYHGNDGSSTPWNDTAQLNYLNPEVREAVTRTILHVARMFPIIRFDAAMTLAKKHYQRLWFPQPGHGGVPSRAEHGMTREAFDAAMPEEFWREVVDRVAADAPDTLLLAEAFWLMEGYFVRTLGMHRVYNSAFMNMLKMEENSKYRQTIKNVLEFNPQVLQRFVNFMNNPDEKTAVEQFGKESKYLGACVLLVTMPGLPMIGHGQVEGFHEKYGMEYKKAYWDEPVDEHLVKEHEKRIFPLMRRRWLFSGADNFVFYDFRTGDDVNEDVFAYSNMAGDQRALVLYHNRFAVAAGWISSSTSMATKVDNGDMQLRRTTLGEALRFKGDGRHYYIFRDYASNLEYIRNGRELCEKGLFMELSAYDYHVFLDFREVWDDEFGNYGRLCHQLEGGAVLSIDEELKQVRYRELIDRLRLHLEKSSGLLTGAFKELTHAGFADIRMKFAAEQTAFMQAVAEQAGLPDFSAEIMPFLNRELDCLEKESEAESSLLSARTARLLAFAWLTLHRLGSLTSSSDLSVATVELVDRFGLGRPLEEELYSEAAEEGDLLAQLDVLSVMALFGLLLRWQRLLLLPAPKQLASIPELLAERNVALFVGRHEGGGFEWIIKERWDLMVEWLALAAAVTATCDAVEGEANGQLIAAIRGSAARLSNLGSASGYRVDLLLEQAAQPSS
jgi:glycosidase